MSTSIQSDRKSKKRKAVFPQPEILLLEDQKRIIACLRQYGSQSRIDLAERLGINNGVMTRYSRELLSLGLISEGPQQKASGRGRPSFPLELRADGGYAVGITVHAGWVDLAIVNLLGKPKSLHSFEFDDATPKAFAKNVSQHLTKLTASLNLWRSKFLGFGLSVPGFAQLDASYRHTVEGLRDWRGLDLSELFASELGGPVWVENDANAAALAEYYNGGQSASDNLILLYLSYGVGGGAIIKGNVFRGAYLNAGEIGGLYPLNSPRPSALDLVSHLNNSNGEKWTLLGLRTSDKIDDPVIVEWAKRAADQLYRAALSGVSWLDPETIVVCGTLPNWITKTISDELNTMPWVKALGDRAIPHIEASELGGSAAAIGAAILPIHEAIVPSILAY